MSQLPTATQFVLFAVAFAVAMLVVGVVVGGGDGYEMVEVPAGDTGDTVRCISDGHGGLSCDWNSLAS